MNPHSRVPWRPVLALNAVSLLAQLGQFGVGFTVVPLWLSYRGFGVAALGVFAAMQWAGMLGGILVAPTLARRHGPRQAVTVGLLASVAGFGILTNPAQGIVLVSAGLLGFGVGVRWIANESWLFRLVPAEMGGRFVGAHETLISVAGLAGPAIAVTLGVNGVATLWIGALVTAAAGLPLLVASAAPGAAGNDAPAVAWETPAPKGPTALPVSSAASAMVMLGLVVAAVAGLGDGALYGLTAKFCEGYSIDPARCAMLLAVFGAGGMLGQYPVGWAADRLGVLAVTTGCAIAGATSSLVLALLGRHIPWAVPAMFVLGVANHAFLTLAVVTIATAPRTQLDRLMRAMSVTFTLGSIAGPLLASAAMARFGPGMLMAQVALICLALCVYAAGLRHGAAGSVSSVAS